jgi:molybdate transport system regulatory protein
MRAILQSHIKLMIAGTDDFTHAFGPGTAELLKGIQITKSLNQTAKSMGMSYSKAWKSIRGTEMALGVTLLERNGAHGSCLTKEGEETLMLFERACAAAKEAANQVLWEHFTIDKMEEKAKNN